MVVLTIVTQNNGETVYLDEPIPQVHFMKLISCSLYNSFDTLKKERIAIAGDEKTSSADVSEIPPGYYTLENLAKLINDMFSGFYYNQLEAKINTPEAVLQIKSKGPETITFNRDFGNIFGINDVLKPITNVKRLRYPSTYLIHCVLIDRNYNFFNNKKSDPLDKIDVEGKPYEKERYDASPQQPIRDCSTSSHVNSITISVRDQNGELFDFKDMPLKFESELNKFSIYTMSDLL